MSVRRGGWRFALLYALACLVALLALDYMIYRVRFARALAYGSEKGDPLERMEAIPAAAGRALGWHRAEKASSFPRFTRRKRPGVTRVGCFGDSFTYGDEVGPAADYPTLLQELFRREGRTDVEVLNFGGSWYGFHQSFVMWEEVGRLYDLDYILLGPTFFLERDCTFNHSYPSATDLLHARYVLEDGEPRRVEPIGLVSARRVRAYYRFLPPWRYLRYDRRAPPFLAALAPRGRVLANPFYYRRDDCGHEAQVLFKALLARMADAGGTVVLGTYHEDLARLARELGRKNVVVRYFDRFKKPPYSTPGGHNSPAGNRLLAEQFYAAIAGRRTLSVERVALSPLPAAAPLTASGAIAPSARSLAEYDRVEVSPGGGARWDWMEASRFKEEVLASAYFAQRGAESLLAVRVGGQSLAESFFLPLSFPLPEGTPVTVGRGARCAGPELGRLRLLRPGIAIGVLDLGAVAVGQRLSAGGALGLLLAPCARALMREGMILCVGGAPVARLWAADKADVALKPLEHRFVIISPASEPLRGTGGERGGTVDIVLSRAGEPSLRVPIARWSRFALVERWKAPSAPARAAR